MMTGAYNNVLFTFDSVVNTDVGILNLIKRDYNNPAFMNPLILKNDEDFFKLLMLTEPWEKDSKINPIYFVLQDEHRNKADDILESIMKEQYKEVLALSPMTDMYNVITMFLNASQGVINVNVLCSSEEEKNFITDINNRICIVMRDSLDMSLYDSIYVKDTTELFDINPEGKNLYILNYRYNYEDDDKKIISGKAIAEFGSANIFNEITAYNVSIPLG